MQDDVFRVYLFKSFILFIHLFIYLFGLGSLMANVLDCDILVSEFELHSRNYVHFLTDFKEWVSWSPKGWV